MSALSVQSSSMYCRPCSAHDVSTDLLPAGDHPRHRLHPAAPLSATEGVVSLHVTLPNGGSCRRPLYRHAYINDVLSDETFLEELKRRRGSPGDPMGRRRSLAAGHGPLRFLCEGPASALSLDREQVTDALFHWRSKPLTNQVCRLKVERSRKPAVSLQAIANKKWPILPPRRKLQPHVTIEKLRTGESFGQGEEKTLSSSPMDKSRMAQNPVVEAAKQQDTCRQPSDRWIDQPVNQNDQNEQKSQASDPHPRPDAPRPNLSYPRPHPRDSRPAKRKSNLRRLVWSKLGSGASDSFPFITECRPPTSQPAPHVDEPRSHRSDPLLNTSDSRPVACPRHHLTKPRPQKSEPRLQCPSTCPKRFPSDSHPGDSDAQLHLRPYQSDAGSQPPEPTFTLTNPWVRVLEPHPPLPPQPRPAKEERQWRQSAWKVQSNAQGERVTYSRQDGSYQTQAHGSASSEQYCMHEECTSMDRVLSWLQTIPVTPSYPNLELNDVTPSNSQGQISRCAPRKRNPPHRACHFTVIKGVTAKLNRREATPVCRLSSPKKREVTIKPVCAFFNDTEYIDLCPCAPQTSPCSSIHRAPTKEQNVSAGQTAQPQNKTENSTSKSKSLRSSKKCAPTPAPLKSLQIAPQPSINVTFQQQQRPQLKPSATTHHRRDKTVLRRASRHHNVTASKIPNEQTVVRSASTALAKRCTSIPLAMRSAATPLARRARRSRHRRAKKKRSRKCKADIGFLDKAIRVLKYNTMLLGRRPGHVELYDPDSGDPRSKDRLASEDISGNRIEPMSSTIGDTGRALRSNSENGLYRPLSGAVKVGDRQKEEWNLK